VTTEAEQVAQEDSFSAEQAWVSAREHLASLVSGLADAVERAGHHTVTGIKAAITDAKADLAATVDAVDRLDSHRDDLVALEGQLVEFAQLTEKMLTQAAAQTARAKAAGTQVRRLTTQLDRLRGADADIDTRELRISTELAAVGRLLDCLDERARTVKASARAIADNEKAYRAAGFADIAEAGEAVLAHDELTALAAQVVAHDEQVAAVRDQLQDPALLAALDVDAPDLAALTTADAAAANRRRQAEQQHARVESARVALSRLAGELDEHQAQSHDLLADSALVEDLARCVEGTGGDNVLRMRLSSYVLAARLEEVAAAATERLLVMSDGRYSLVHSDALAKGGVRSGLGLQVVDGWTGVERDTATLSGGESFLASLALALGLADAVQAEAGGAVMQTLFIDEGFGMLDEETLDEVMTVLDSLREGGRSVGLVSHVADLRDRIPAQLEVRKSRTGSRIVVPDAGAA
jgi:exonuclease SbcC